MEVYSTDEINNMYYKLCQVKNNTKLYSSDLCNHCCEYVHYDISLCFVSLCILYYFLNSRRSSSIINDMPQPKQELQASLANLDKHITATVHARLSNIHANDASLTKQTKTLQSRTHEARK